MSLALVPYLKILGKGTYGWSCLLLPYWNTQSSRKIDFDDLLKEIKNIFKCDSIKYTQVVNKKVEKIAVCGGSGSFLTKEAIRSGADVFITSDFKYHDFFEANNQITLIDIGHYES